MLELPRENFLLRWTALIRFTRKKVSLAYTEDSVFLSLELCYIEPCTSVYLTLGRVQFLEIKAIYLQSLPLLKGQL